MLSLLIFKFYSKCMDQVNHLMVSVLRENLCIERVYMYFEIGCVIYQENAAFKITLEIGDNLFFSIVNAALVM